MASPQVKSNSSYLLDVDELDLLRFSLELVAALLLARLVDDDVGLRRLPVDAPNAREGVDRGAEDLVSGELIKHLQVNYTDTESWSH